MNIELKKWSIDDKESLMKVFNGVDRKYLSEGLPYPYTEDDASKWVDFVAENDGTNGTFRAIMVDGEIVGEISIKQKADSIFSKDAEIGYVLLADRWSGGIVTEAVKQICEIAFAQLSIIRITGMVFERNIASRRVLEKNGFELEGIMKKAVVKGENIYDLCVYGKLK